MLHRKFIVLGAGFLLLCTPVFAQEVDTDGDTLSDSIEVQYGTNPLDADTDGGGEADAAEINAGRNPLLKDDDLTYDQDSDGLINAEEMALGTDPTKPDTDGDDTNDGNDMFPLDFFYALDADNDGVPDEFEQRYGLSSSDPSDATADIDDDGLTNEEEFALGTNPIHRDTDADGTEDGPDAFPLETAYSNDDDDDGLPDKYESEHNLDPHDPSDAGKDPDNDELTNTEEFIYGTNPQQADTDRDGETDGAEVAAGTNPTESACLVFTDPRPALSDVVEHWSRDTVSVLQRTKVLPSGKRLIEGYEQHGERFFAPDTPISRYELLKLALLSSCISLDSASVVGSADIAFSDLGSSVRPHEDTATTELRRVVYTAARLGIVQGYTDGTFRPHASVTRAEALKILLSAAELPPSEGIRNLSGLRDVPERAWFYEPVQRALAYQLVSGYEDGTFRPAQDITRAEAAAVVYRLLLVNPNINGYEVSE